MKISLCLPCYQRPELLAFCLDSVLRQTHADYEVILKDGCTIHPVLIEPILERRVTRLGRRLRYILSADGGIFPALNEALKNSTGELLYFLCSDDSLGDEETLSSVAEAFKDLDLSQPHWLYGTTGGMDEEGRLIEYETAEFLTFDEYMRRRGGIGQPAVFWSRGMYEALGDFGTEYKHAADYAYWVRCFRTAPPMFLPKVLGIGRKWPGCSSHIHAEEVEREAAHIQARYWKERP